MAATNGHGANVAAGPSLELLQQTVAVMRQLAADRGLLARLPEEERNRLLKAASTLSFPGRAARRQLTRAFRQQRRAQLQQHKQADEQLLEQTGIRAQFSQLSVRQLKQPCPSAPFVQRLPTPVDVDDQHFDRELRVARNCYICKQDYRRLHFFYDSLCPSCATLNWTKRNQTADLSGRYALVTGGRVKIGYQAALKLLRGGAYVIVTTRFPHDATQRFAAEHDHGHWQQRLQIHGLDLRHTPSVEALAEHLIATLPRLDYILNNACQTVRRPPGFYAHLMEGERRLGKSLAADAGGWLASHRELEAHGATEPTTAQLPREVTQTLAGIHRSAELSQLQLVPDDDHADAGLFPTGQLDGDWQQVDLRSTNSWRLKLADVPTIELLEVHLVNAVAPFVLNARLKPLMKETAAPGKQIVNVSAMEGVFYRAYKTDRHPHTNMAKAALNMMTRTSAQDYVADGIYMNSVDTGWITDEDPAKIARRKKDELGFCTPLDLIDAAARICDPVFCGVLTGENVWGKFLKDYQVANW